MNKHNTSRKSKLILNISLFILFFGFFLFDGAVCIINLFLGKTELYALTVTGIICCGYSAVYRLFIISDILSSGKDNKAE